LATDLRPDLVVLDVKMPKMDGISAAEQIAGQRIAPVIMLTAFSQRDLVERASQAGAMAYVVKPFGKADLIPAIEVARARFAEIQAVEAEVSDLTERLESRKAVDRAKAMLQSGLGLTDAGGCGGRHRARRGQQEDLIARHHGLVPVLDGAPGCPAM
jgi:response regulator NasT